MEQYGSKSCKSKSSIITLLFMVVLLLSSCVGNVEPPITTRLPTPIITATHKTEAFVAIETPGALETSLPPLSNNTVATQAPAETASPIPIHSDASKQHLDGELKIIYLDVGQADSILVVLPNGKSMLIDAGEQSGSGKTLQYLRDNGIDNLDYVIATHPHADHIGGMAAVIREIAISNIYMPKAVHTTTTFEDLLDAIDEKDLLIQTAKAGRDIFDYGNIRAAFIAPVTDAYADLNNYSAVVMLSYNDNRFLFMGDAEKESEAEILSVVIVSPPTF